MINFTVPGKPVSSNATYRRGRGPGLYKSPEAEAWQYRLKAHARVASAGQRIEGPVMVLITYYFESQRPDIDGPVKATLDCLQGAGGCFLNDRQVAHLQVFRKVDRERPRTEVVVAPFQAVELVASPEALFDAWDEGFTVQLRKP